MNRRVAIIGLLIVFTLSSQVAVAAEKPNVILIMADDLGYRDLSCYGSKLIETPVLDRLAEEGIRLTSFYAGATVCTPSRMALLTGAYPPRVGWQGGVVGYGIKHGNGLAPEALTMAEVFKAEGYQTGICGKWHLGDTPELLPMNQGFDAAYYITRSNNQTKKLWRDGELIADPFDNRRLTEQFIAEAIKFIDANREKPFFLYIPLTAPHFPAEAHPDWKGKSRNGAFGDVVEEMDARIGLVVESLKKLKLDEKTMIVFISDNGPEPGQKKWARGAPYRGLKWSSMEGGTRVPCIIRWPGVIPSGRESGELTAAIDLLPTIAAGCGIDLANISKGIPKLDGVNVWETLIGKNETPHPRKDLLYWNGWAKPEAIRVGEWKLYLKPVKGIEGSKQGPVLINLREDPAEETNLADEYPAKVEQMKALAEKQLAEIEQNSIPIGRPAPKRKK